MIQWPDDRWRDGSITQGRDGPMIQWRDGSMTRWPDDPMVRSPNIPFILSHFHWAEQLRMSGKIACGFLDKLAMRVIIRVLC